MRIKIGIIAIMLISILVSNAFGNFKILIEEPFVNVEGEVLKIKL